MKDIITNSITDNKIDLQFFDGDFVIRETLQQDIALNLKYQKGQLKSDLNVGVGVDSMLQGQLTPFIKTLIFTGLSYDNIIISDVTYEDNDLKVKI